LVSKKRKGAVRRLAGIGLLACTKTFSMARLGEGVAKIKSRNKEGERSQRKAGALARVFKRFVTSPHTSGPNPLERAEGYWKRKKKGA